MNKPPFEIFAYFIKTYPGRSLLVLVALLLAGVIETIGIGALLPLLNVIIDTQPQTKPNVLTQAINQIFNGLGLEQNFTNLLFIIVITISLKSIVIYQAMKTVGFSAIDITKDMRTKLIKSLMNARWQYYSALPTGQSATAIATEAEQAGQFFMLTGKAIAALIQVAIYTTIAFLVDWKISLLAIVVGSIAAFLFKSLIKTARKSGIEMADFLQALVIRLHEALLGAKPLKAMGQESRFLSLLERDIFAVNKSKKRQLISNLLLQAFQEPLLIVLISSGLYWAYTYANYPIPELLLIAFLFYRLISQIGQVQAHYQKSTNVEGAVRSILKSLHSAQENNEVITGEKQPSYQKGISFIDVSLSYDDNLILDKFNDRILPHKLSVIFGPSGVGKSTLLDSILGFITPTAGKILIDDQPLEQLDIKKWRQMIGYVPQETFLFHDTILQNITLGDHGIKQDDVLDALKTANAWEFVEQIEDGLNHIVGERGGKLSGGQKQRLALARALVRKPDILILDEATTGLDKESENAILSSLKNMLRDTTIIAISHDPKILDIADHVIHLDKKS